MELIFYFFVFIFGLCIGSFLNVVIYRLAKEQGLGGRSYCPHCRHKLSWLDLLPVVSFLWLGGKCRYCAKKISWQYPVVELATGLMFVLVFSVEFLQIPYLVLLWYLTASLIVIFVYDLKYFLIPDSVLFPAIGITVIYQIIFSPHFFISNAFWSAVGVFAFFAAIFFISQGKWMGFGDCKLVVLLGLLLGFPNILAGLFLAFFFGAIIGIALMVLKLPAIKKLNIGLKSEIPFAPFLISGAFLALFFGQAIIQWYAHLFLL